MKLLKTSFCVLFLTLTANFATAQGWGVRAGANFSKISDSDTNTQTGVYAGLYKQIGIVPKILFIQPEIQFSAQGFDTNTSSYNLNYVQIPVVARVYFLKFISVETGPQFGYLVSNKADNGFSPEYKKLDTAWDFGLTFNLPFGLSIDGRFITGLNDIIDHNTDSKNQVFQLGAGFKF